MPPNAQSHSLKKKQKIPTKSKRKKSKRKKVQKSKADSQLGSDVAGREIAVDEEMSEAGPKQFSNILKLKVDSFPLGS